MNTIISLLELQSMEIDNRQTKDIFENTKNRIKSMMFLYDKLYSQEDYKNYSVRDYFSDLVDEILFNFPNKAKVEIEKELDDFSLI